MQQNSFLFQAFIYLAAAVAMVPVAKKLALGSVLGYLVAGILIGPAVFGFVGQEGKDIMHFAEFGVVMMLFLIGLELEPELLLKLKKPIIGLGGLQVVFSSLLIGLIALGLGLPWQHSMALGFILSLSSTAIIMQTLTEKGLLQSAAGQSSFSVLLFQDIAVIPMLALLPLLATHTITEPAITDHSSVNLIHGLPAWLQTIAVLGAVLVIILAGRFLIRPFLRIIASTHLRELFTATALLLVVGITVLMTIVGLSPALGTFLAGVVLANSEYRHELESDIEPFKGLLLGLFFISVGASIDFNLIGRQPLLIIELVFLLMAIKAMILFLLGKLFQLKLDQNLLFAVLLSQVGEFAFVLFTFSRQEGILPAATTDLMIAVVAISMALTPIILLLHEKIIQPRIGTKEMQEHEADTIREQNPVIIAGFGDFGNMVGRFLRAHQIGMTILDNNSDRVDLLRKIGFKVYYGDASRYDLLQAAGADKARLIVITIDPPEKRLEMINTIKKHFPNLYMLVRASNRYDAYDQMNAGMLHVYRETMDTALRIGVDAMKLMGHRAYTAQRAARTFLKIDEENLKKLASIKDDEEYIITARAKIEELEKMLQADTIQFTKADDKGWDEESLIADANKKSIKE